MGRELRTLSIIGTRPQILKLCPWEKTVLYTNQHYDADMSQGLEADGRKVMYLEKHDTNNPEITVAKIRERLLLELEPDVIIVHGDCFSTLAGALYAKSHGIPLAHVEAGPRCFMDTTEEGIRKRVASLATWNFSPTKESKANLVKEGFINAYDFGDLLYDKYLEDRCAYTLVTIHRRENLTRERLGMALDVIGSYEFSIWPIHPHTKRMIQEYGMKIPETCHVLPPLDYRTMMYFIKGAARIFTDSGGVERQAFFTGTPCLVFREKSEWSKFTQSMAEFGSGNACARIYSFLQKEVQRG